MRATVELNGYAEGAGAQPGFRPLVDGVRVRSLPTTVVLRAVWRAEPGDDDPPGFLPIGRLLLAHAEPGEEPAPAPMPDLFRSPLERWDGASIIFVAYTLRLRNPGEHRLLFLRAELPEMTLRVRVSEWGSQ